MFTTVAFYESIDLAGALGNLAALSDDTVFTSGDNLRVPELNQIVAVSAGLASGGAGYARLDAPSLNDLTNLYVSPVNGNQDGDAEPDSVPVVHDYRATPMELRTDEDLQALGDSNSTAAAAQWVIVWLADGPIDPISSAGMFTVRATNTSTLTADAWTQGELTFAESLPVGRYQVIGMRATSAGLVAARLVLRGSAWRPGVLGTDNVNDLDHAIFRSGKLGVFGEFHSTAPPAVEFLSISADSSQVVFLDLLYLG